MKHRELQEPAHVDRTRHGHMSHRGEMFAQAGTGTQRTWRDSHRSHVVGLTQARIDRHQQGLGQAAVVFLHPVLQIHGVYRGVQRSPDSAAEPGSARKNSAYQRAERVPGGAICTDAENPDLPGSPQVLKAVGGDV